MEAHRIAVLSDTHGLLRPEVTDILKTCEAILHGGDIGAAEVLESLNAIARTYAVRGNADRDWAEALPVELEAELFGFRIYMVHNKKHIREDLSGIDLVVCGHSHKYEESAREGILYLNPGSCGPRRFRLPITMMLLTLYSKEHRAEAARVEFPFGHPSGEAARGSLQNREALQNGAAALSDRDMYRLVKAIIKDVDAGRPVADIASRNYVNKNHADRELVEQICRMYITHPGVDVDGILDRMERKNL